jgi:DNA topoisomerase-1
MRDPESSDAALSRSKEEDRLLRELGLRRTAPGELTIRRQRRGKGFSYLDQDQKRITDLDALTRIRSLAIPPAYKDVRIARDPRSHLQAVGLDDMGRVQYRYHPDWELVREQGKIDRLAVLARVIPRIRRAVARDLDAELPTKKKALAAVVGVIDRTHIRIGCEGYVHSGRSRGATTLLKRHVRIDGDELRLTFRGKGGRDVECGVRAPGLARVIGELAQLPGPRLFKYRDESGRIRAVSAGEVNAYLRDIAKAPVSAKDFRTLAATATAATRLAAIEPASRPTPRRRQIAAVMRDIAALLGNTPAVTRKSYVHRALVNTFAAGALTALSDGIKGNGRQTKGEALVATLFAEPQALVKETPA